MDPERWRQIDELFNLALDRPEAERASFLESACGDDLELRREVERMLQFDAEAASFIERPAFDASPASVADPAPSMSGAETLLEARTAGERSDQAAATASIDEARFAPGTLLDDRYRIVSLIGRGGMGEVYRADDLKLRQAVALKFLPERLSSDGAALARLFQEVRLARQVSHRNVCRVYDVGEAAGLHFISMEFVRGEELSVLLRRIGRFPEERAVEVARQICAGLAAIHDRGVIHRDLKPANVLVDDRGTVRIADFGLAAVGEVSGREAAAGTPAYMSPEQLAGAELTPQSDIYSLGLVLYEVFTGRRAFEASSMAELLRLRQSSSTPTRPSEIVSSIDPLVEHAIERCLAREPAARPASALKVAAALPGGDPLAAALAAGETPSPEMVAAAHTEGASRPAVATALLAATLLALALVCLLSGPTLIHRAIPLEKPPEVLDDRAAALFVELGYDGSAVDRASGFGFDEASVSRLYEEAPSDDVWEQLATGKRTAILFWHRRSPEYLEPTAQTTVTASNPPRTTPGMAGVSLDTLGRLRSFYAVPPEQDVPDARERAVDWGPLFAAAELEMASLRPVDPALVPPTFADERAAWEGISSLQQAPVRVEAAAYRGRPVFFEVVHEPEQRLGAAPQQTGARSRLQAASLITFFLAIFAGSVLLAWRNLRLGRGDKRGARVLALVAFWISILFWIFSAHHSPTPAEFRMLIEVLGSALFSAAFVAVLYLALEPIVRRSWPEQLISWNRVLAGQFRDPLVGRDVLVGVLAGALVVLAMLVRVLAPAWVGAPTVPVVEPGAVHLGLSAFPVAFARQLHTAFMFALVGLFLLVGLSILLRRRWAAAVVAIAVAFLLVSFFGTATHPVRLVFVGVGAVVMIGVIYRFGLLAAIASQFALSAFVWFPITSELTAWYAAGFAIDLAIMVALALYGFRTALAGQPLVSARLLDG